MRNFGKKKNLARYIAIALMANMLSPLGMMGTVDARSVVSSDMWQNEPAPVGDDMWQSEPTPVGDGTLYSEPTDISPRSFPTTDGWGTYEAPESDVKYATKAGTTFLMNGKEIAKDDTNSYLYKDENGDIYALTRTSDGGFKREREIVNSDGEIVARKTVKTSSDGAETEYQSRVLSTSEKTYTNVRNALDTIGNVLGYNTVEDAQKAYELLKSRIEAGETNFTDAERMFWDACQNIIYASNQYNNQLSSLSNRTLTSENLVAAQQILKEEQAKALESCRNGENCTLSDRGKAAQDTMTMYTLQQLNSSSSISESVGATLNADQAKQAATASNVGTATHVIKIVDSTATSSSNASVTSQGLKCEDGQILNGSKCCPADHPLFNVATNQCLTSSSKDDDDDDDNDLSNLAMLMMMNNRGSGSTTTTTTTTDGGAGGGSASPNANGGSANGNATTGTINKDSLKGRLERQEVAGGILFQYQLSPHWKKENKKGVPIDVVWEADLPTGIKLIIKDLAQARLDVYNKQNNTNATMQITADVPYYDASTNRIQYETITLKDKTPTLLWSSEKQINGHTMVPARGINKVFVRYVTSEGRKWSRILYVDVRETTSSLSSSTEASKDGAVEIDFDKIDESNWQDGNRVLNIGSVYINGKVQSAKWNPDGYCELTVEEGAVTSVSRTEAFASAEPLTVNVPKINERNCSNDRVGELVTIDDAEVSIDGDEIKSITADGNTYMSIEGRPVPNNLTDADANIVKVDTGSSTPLMFNSGGRNFSTDVVTDLSDGSLKLTDDTGMIVTSQAQTNAVLENMGLPAGGTLDVEASEDGYSLSVHYPNGEHEDVVIPASQDYNSFIAQYPNDQYSHGRLRTTDDARGAYNTIWDGITNATTESINDIVRLAGNDPEDRVADKSNLPDANLNNVTRGDNVAASNTREEQQQSGAQEQQAVSPMMPQQGVSINSSSGETNSQQYNPTTSETKSSTTSSNEAKSTTANATSAVTASDPKKEISFNSEESRQRMEAIKNDPNTPQDIVDAINRFEEEKSEESWRPVLNYLRQQAR